MGRNSKRFQNVTADMRHYLRGRESLDFKAFLRLLSRELGFQALAVYRLGRWQRNGGLSATLLLPILYPCYLLLRTFVRLAYDIHIAESATIGPGFYIGHFGGIRVDRCSIGAGCAIQQQVWITPSVDGGPGPSIGDRVWIGAHAKLQGAIQIGSGATVAAGSLVNSDVAPNCLWLGRPGRVARFNYDNTSFL